MKDKILREIMEWYNNQSQKPEHLTEEFLDTVINTTADVIIEKIQMELTDEFEKGNLKHSLILSDEYYLYLKLKDIKNEIVASSKDEDYIKKEK